MKLEVFPMGIFQVNSYLLTCEETGATVVVDPGDEPQILLQHLEARGVKPEAILNTHGHVDHVSGNGAIQDRFGVPILMHAADRFLVDRFEEQAALFGLHLPPPPAPDGELKDGETFQFGKTVLDIRLTPGHSPGSVTLLSGDQAIAGDVLFAGSIGRTDLPGGDLATLLRSIDEILIPLGDDMRIHPGHGPSTSIGHERRTNPFLQEAVRRELMRTER